VDEYSTYFVAGEQLSEAVWVHNDCWDRRTGPDGPQPEGFSRVTGPDRTTDFDQQIYRGDDGRLIYEGHDGRFYDIEANPPTEHPLAIQQSIRPNSARRRLDRALGGVVVGDGLDAHHLIPLEMLGTHSDLLRRAARGGFDINGANSGMLLGSDRHIGGHPDYNSAVSNELGLIDPNLPPAEIARQVQDIAYRIQRAIVNGTFGPWQ